MTEREDTGGAQDDEAGTQEKRRRIGEPDSPKTTDHFLLKGHQGEEGHHDKAHHRVGDRRVALPAKG